MNNLNSESIALNETCISILKCSSFGMTNLKIAETLNISLEEVKSNMQKIYAKLGTYNKLQSVIAAYKLDII